MWLLWSPSLLWPYGDDGDILCFSCYHCTVLRAEKNDFLLDTSKGRVCDCRCSTSYKQHSRGKAVFLSGLPVLFLKKEKSPRGERTPTLAILWQASNRYHSFQLPGQLWPRRANLARVRSSMPFSTSLLLETIYWHVSVKRWKEHLTVKYNFFSIPRSKK